MSNTVTKTRLNYFANKLWTKTKGNFLSLSGGTLSGSLNVNSTVGVNGGIATIQGNTGVLRFIGNKSSMKTNAAVEMDGTLATFLPMADGSVSLGQPNNKSGGRRFEGVYARLLLNSDNIIRVTTDSASNAGWELRGVNYNGVYHAEIVPHINDIAVTGSTFSFMFSKDGKSGEYLMNASLLPTTHEAHSLGSAAQKRWKNVFISDRIDAHKGPTGFELRHGVDGRNNAVFFISARDASGGNSATLKLYSESGPCYISPEIDAVTNHNRSTGLGRAIERYRDVWSQNGAIQSCDINSKDNIELINGENSSYVNKRNMSLQPYDIYNFVKNINIYGYEYRDVVTGEIDELDVSSKQLGILAQEAKECSKVWEYLGISDEEGGEAIKQGSINGILLSTVKTLIEEVESLKNKIK